MENKFAPLRIVAFSPSYRRFGGEITLMNMMMRIPSELLIKVAVSRFGGELLYQFPSEITTFCYESDRHFLTRVADRIYNFFLKKWKGDDYVPLWLIRISKQFPADFWHVNTLLQPDLIRAAKKLGIPTVLHVHELDLAFQWIQEERDILDMVNMPDLIISCSEAAKKFMGDLGRKEATEVVYGSVIMDLFLKIGKTKNPIIREKYGIAESRFVWANSGFICSRKNPLLFIHLADELIRKGYDVHFMWIGACSSPYAFYAKKLAEFLQISDRITWTGELTDQEYRETFNIADGFVLTSTQESFSGVTLEAICLGKPVVVTPCGGVTEIVQDYIGIVTEGWEVSELAAAMIRVMGGDFKRDEERTLQHIKQFDCKNQAELWIKIMQQYFGKKKEEMS